MSAFANTDGGRLLIGVRDDGNLSGVRSEEEIYMMHVAAFKYCKPQPTLKFETFHVDGRTIVVATVYASDRKPVLAKDYDGRDVAYIRIADENIVASPVHLALWKEQRRESGTAMAYTDEVRTLLAAVTGPMSLAAMVKSSHLPRRLVIRLVAKLILFGVMDYAYEDGQFLFFTT